ncbi:MAG: methyltransferase [Candidatus Lokiarchaeota archaeon]|jgi:16S rRNA (guanine1207-N2)-methyltransferase|nr:methyltransferase [Candidatus Lokiarchaeota archaeon]MBD3200581.1 methyltransferase [Candidatus Lokiarchaeota archaeon]
MKKKNNQHYSTKYPDVQLKVHSVSESLRRHLYIFKTTTGVFSYRKIDLGTKVLIRNLEIPPNSNKLLDLGCGYGPIGMVLGYESHESEIYFIEINRRAIWCVKENIKINLPNSQNRTHVLSGNYFDALKEDEITFDAIYMNPPLRKGRNEFLSILHQAPKYLATNGFFEFVIRKKMGAPYVYKYFTKKFPNGKITIKVKRSGYWVFQCSYE